MTKENLTNQEKEMKGNILSVIKEMNFQKELRDDELHYISEIYLDRDDIDGLSKFAERHFQKHKSETIDGFWDSILEEYQDFLISNQDQMEDEIKKEFIEKFGEMDDDKLELFERILQEKINVYSELPSDLFSKLKVNSFFAITSEDDIQVDFSLNAHFFEGQEENDYNFDKETLSAPIFLLAKKLGYTVEQIFDGFYDNSNIKTKSFESIIDEMNSATNECNILGFPVLLSVENFLKIKDAKEVQLPIGVDKLGLFAPFVGGGSLLSIYNQKEVNLINTDEENYEFKLFIDGYFSYTVSDVYGISHYEEQSIKIIK